MMKITPLFCKPLIEVNIDIDTKNIEKTFSKFELEKHNNSNLLHLSLDMNVLFSHIRTNTIYDPPLENNVYNSSQWVLNPKQNDLILFPSELNHQIKKSTIEETRYSIAFNVLPKGLLGYKDSIIKIGEI